MQLTRPQLIIVGVAGFIVLFFLLGFLGVIPIFRDDVARQNVKLEVWGIDDQGPWGDAIARYNGLYPGSSVRYTKIGQTNYEQQLLDALAAGTGPDIFMFHNTWLPKHQNKIVGATAEQISVSTFRNLFPPVAEEDFINNGQIFASPIYIDTLALFYNRDILAAKQVAIVPTTWDGMKQVIPKVREFNSQGNLSKSALAIGGTLKSVTNATDIMSLLFLQFKTEMIRGGTSVGLVSEEGTAALNFYTQFSNPRSAYYTWLDSFKPSIDSFASKQTAMILAYATQIPEVKAKNPALNFIVAPAPQLKKEEPINYASYWGLAVSSKTKYSKAAWDFILLATTNESLSRGYMTATDKPPALNSLINENFNSSTLGVFATQALTAKSWRQPDNIEVQRAFNNMIESVITGKLTVDKALREAQDKITSLLK